MRNRAWRIWSKKNSFHKRMRAIYLSWGKHSSVNDANLWPNRFIAFSNWKEFADSPRNYIWRKVRGDTWRAERQWKVLDNKKEDLDEKRQAYKEIEDEINNINKNEIL